MVFTVAAVGHDGIGSTHEEHHTPVGAEAQATTAASIGGLEI
jgi:hypothetical protein